MTQRSDKKTAEKKIKKILADFCQRRKIIAVGGTKKTWNRSLRSRLTERRCEWPKGREIKLHYGDYRPPPGVGHGVMERKISRDVIGGRGRETLRGGRWFEWQAVHGVKKNRRGGQVELHLLKVEGRTSAKRNIPENIYDPPPDGNSFHIPNPSPLADNFIMPNDTNCNKIIGNFYKYLEFR